jgi:hypothetical protein
LGRPTRRASAATRRQTVWKAPSMDAPATPQPPDT